MEAIQIVRNGKVWAVKHKGSFLGYVSSHGEATRIACALAAQVVERGAAPLSATTIEPHQAELEGFSLSNSVKASRHAELS